MNKVEILGKHFGYPQCCIDSFIETMGAVGNPQGAKAGEETGFIPCPSCAKKVLDGVIDLKDLIINRKHGLKFPNQNSDLLKKELNIKATPKIDIDAIHEILSIQLRDYKYFIVAVDRKYPEVLNTFSNYGKKEAKELLEDILIQLQANTTIDSYINNEK